MVAGSEDFADNILHFRRICYLCFQKSFRDAIGFLDDLIFLNTLLGHKYEERQRIFMRRVTNILSF